MYYPLDDAIMNKGNLTLISLNYICHLSQLLQLSLNKIKLSNYSKDNVIPTKKYVLDKMKADCKDSETGVINNVCDISMTRINGSCLTRNIE